MCNQAVCLLAAAIEARGIPTVCIVLLREVAEKVRPPRALAVPYPHGYPLGAPHDPEVQRAVVRAALAMLAEDGPGPLLRDL
jgi:D-proline reductase (dithiol) PrdB